ncbi:MULTISPECIES: hypothetical protein [unclassified Streptomyces]|uniref:hypothetical protein n=1 Tax=Streptomyces sp. T21Q-yed TaxID=3018441 RepID=UPI002365079C|nr:MULTISPECIES: hypothetical protein [unclassified Streptomyces]MDF3140303.1 hypothetical protein [Streptomyces sp. T21Q-yed]WDF44111.1 hypothetical protein PBV52_48700 [Streptomyces sp. T12]
MTSWHQAADAFVGHSADQNTDVMGLGEVPPPLFVGSATCEHDELIDLARVLHRQCHRAPGAAPQESQCTQAGHCRLPPRSEQRQDDAVHPPGPAHRYG